MRTPVSVRLFNLQPCKNFAFAVLLVANCRETLFSANSAQMQYSTSKQRLCCAVFFVAEMQVRKFCERSKILQKVKKFAASNCGVRRIPNVFACSCRYKTACILTCLCFVFLWRKCRLKNFAKDSKILQKVQKFATSNCGVKRIPNVFAIFSFTKWQTF